MPTKSEKIIKRYRDAYKAIHGHYPTVTRRGSWFYINWRPPVSSWRLSQLEEMAKTLEKRKE